MFQIQFELQSCDWVSRNQSRHDWSGIDSRRRGLWDHRNPDRRHSVRQPVRQNMMYGAEGEILVLAKSGC
jgi:hypothetical protein